MKKKAIVVASFGTTYPEARERSIGGIERAVAKAFPGWDVVRAFTSGMVIARLQKQGVLVETLPEALDRLRGEGYETLCVLPTHIVAGIEYEKVLRAGEGLPCAKPLLYEEADYAAVVRLLGEISGDAPGATLWMGHGTEHAANMGYTLLRTMLRAQLPEKALLACVEGSLTLDTLWPELEALPDKHITLRPFMVVAGDHACNDLAGEAADSWQSRLRARGFATAACLQGLGELPQVQALYIEKLRRVLP